MGSQVCAPRKFELFRSPVHVNPFTVEELEYAKAMNCLEGDDILAELEQVEKAEEYLEEVCDEKDWTWRILS